MKLLLYETNISGNQKTDSGFTYLQRSFESNASTKDEAARELTTLFLRLVASRDALKKLTS